MKLFYSKIFKTLIAIIVAIIVFFVAMEVSGFFIRKLPIESNKLKGLFMVIIGFLAAWYSAEKTLKKLNKNNPD